MIVFFLSVAALLLLALFFILRALMRGTMDDSPSREQQNVAIAREKLADLEKQRERGDLAEQEYTAQKAELERSLLDDLATIKENPESALSGGGQWAAIAVAALLPILSGALYLSLGSPTTVVDEAPAVARTPGDEQHPADIQQMVSQLAQRMEQNPDDAEGWAMLARSYMALKLFPKAVDAYENLHRLIGDDPQLLVRYADALAMANNGVLEGRPTEMVKRALQLQPDNAQGLWMAGTAARQAGDYDQAVVHLRKLVPLLEGDPQTQNEIRELIRSTEGMLQTADGSATAQPPQDGAEVAASDSAPPPTVGSAASLTVSVSLDPSLKDAADPQDLVFIFARAMNGPPMPLAVVRKRVADLPVTVTLDDSAAMMPQMSLSKFPEVRVGARISKTGQPLPQSGDLQGIVAPVAHNQAGTVQISINQRVP